MLLTHLTLLSYSLYSVGLATAADTHRHHHRRLSRAHLLKTREEIVQSSNHPPAIYKTFGKGIPSPLRKRGTFEEAATAFIESELGLSTDEYRIQSSAPTNTGGHVWVQRTVNGIPVANAVANVGLNTDKDIIAFGTSFDSSTGSTSAAATLPTQPTISEETAIKVAAAKMGGTYSERPVKLEYYVEEDGTLTLTYVVVINSITLDEEGEEQDMHVYEAFVDAQDTTGRVLGANNFSSRAAYRAVPPRLHDISQEGTTLFVDPVDTFSSPNGWHSANDTSGNNVIVFLNRDITATTKPTTDGLVFDYPYNLTAKPSEGLNIEAAKTAAFYMSNLIHDINYRYGFTETAFNFQQDNFGKGGIGDDRIQISVQDSRGKNNAFFTTYGEEKNGGGGYMKLYLWTKAAPARDSALANDVIAHEQTHGTTNRMTGGGTARCLQSKEAEGMGEGWSDAYANWMEQSTETVTDFVMGAWVYNSPGGLRSYPYSTDPNVNPLKYSNLITRSEAHDVGEIWANMLHNVYAELVKAYGWTADAFTNADSSAGNVIFMRNFFDGLLLQPCNPTMLQARDAWIQGDRTRYNGAHVCTIWKAFASRGLGSNATSVPRYTDDFNVPDECLGPKTSTTLPTSTTSSLVDSTSSSQTSSSTLTSSSTAINSTSSTQVSSSSTTLPSSTGSSYTEDSTSSTQPTLTSSSFTETSTLSTDTWSSTQVSSTSLSTSTPTLTPSSSSTGTSSTSSVTTCAQTYTSKAGDTCASIEGQFGLPSGSILAVNSFLNCQDIWVYTPICIPVGGSTTTRTSTTLAPTCVRTYISQALDTCANIEARFGLPSGSILAANSFLNCQDIWVNTPICIPPGSSTRTSTTPTSTSTNGPAPTCVSTYTAVAGDTCTKIEYNYELPTGSIQAANPSWLKCADIWAYTPICIPPGGSGCTLKISTTSTDVTCAAVASRYGTTTALIQAWNPSWLNCNDVWPNTPLCVRH